MGDVQQQLMSQEQQFLKQEQQFLSIDGRFDQFSTKIDSLQTIKLSSTQPSKDSSLKTMMEKLFKQRSVISIVAE